MEALRSASSLFQLAADYRKDIKDDVANPGYVTSKSKGGSIEWQRGPKCAHSALRTLKAINSQLDSLTKADPLALKKLNQDDLKNIRHLAKDINAGFTQKYVKSNGNFIDGLRIMIGKRSESEKVEAQLNKINDRINEALGHKPKAFESTKGPNARTINDMVTLLNTRLSRIMFEFIPSGKKLSKIHSTLKKEFHTIVDDYIKALPNLNAEELKEAKRELEYIKKHLEQNTLTEDRFLHGLGVMFGDSMLSEELNAKHSEFYKAYRKALDVELERPILEKVQVEVEKIGKSFIDETLHEVISFYDKMVGNKPTKPTVKPSNPNVTSEHSGKKPATTKSKTPEKKVFQSNQQQPGPNLKGNAATFKEKAKALHQKVKNDNS